MAHANILEALEDANLALTRAASLIRVNRGKGFILADADKINGIIDLVDAEKQRINSIFG